jgi:hypothetical protein
MKQLIYAVLLISATSWADNTINIDQIGDNNSITVTQDGTQHTATVTLGKTSSVDYTTLSVVQQGTGAKTATVEIKSGISNGVNIFQDGTGAHTASIQNLTGSGNNIGITQSGAGNHIMNITNPWNATNTGNTVNATQSGGAGADKRFDLMFSGATGAGVTVIQTNPTQSDQGGMNIQCNPCGNGWSYIRY